MNPYKHLVGFLGRGIGSSQGLYLHRTAQQRKMWTYTHASSGIRTYEPSVRGVIDICRLRVCSHWDRHNSNLDISIIRQMSTESLVLYNFVANL
jgi:hypothetical protein